MPHASHLALAHTHVAREARTSNVGEHERRLQALLMQEVTPEGGPLDIEVRGGCGEVEVRVAGPTGELRLPFDRAELHPAYVLRVVRQAVKRYRTSLGCRSRTAS